MKENPRNELRIESIFECINQSIFVRQGFLGCFSLFISNTRLNILINITCIYHMLTLDTVLGDRKVESRGNI